MNGFPNLFALSAIFFLLCMIMRFWGFLAFSVYQDNGDWEYRRLSNRSMRLSSLFYTMGKFEFIFALVVNMYLFLMRLFQ